MTDWVIGDIHGCRKSFDEILERIDWREGRDRIFSTGDLVNRGPRSDEILRWFRKTEGAEAVLGNHDLHLLARAVGLRKHRKEDRFEKLLAAEDSEENLDWLARRPFMLELGSNVFVHAGVLPSWSFEEAREKAAECSEVLKTRGIQALYAGTKESRPARNAQIFTRMRAVDSSGLPDYSFVQGLEMMPAHCRPWFYSNRMIRQGYRIIFGHWAMLGLYRAEGVQCLDSGCIYGGGLTAMSLDDGRLVQASSRPEELWVP